MKRLISLGPFLLLILGPLPLLYFLFLTHQQSLALDKTEEKINILHQKFALAKLQKEKENTFLNKIKTSSPYYIDQQLESLVFSNKESQLRFVEGTIRRTKELQEVEEKQESAITVNEADLKKMLTLIEEVTIPPFTTPKGAPQLLFQSFDLKKIPVSAHENLFEVTMNLIKREGIR